MTDQTRPYRMQRRAESQEQTRLRITESAVALHGTVGPSRTSMSAVAAHAGVRRSTLYRHFADEAALFDACTAHWASRQPAARSRRAGRRSTIPTSAWPWPLGELYAYYRRTERMLDNLFRDETTVPLSRSGSRPSAATSRRRGRRSWQGRRLRGAARRRTRAAHRARARLLDLEVARAGAGARRRRGRRADAGARGRRGLKGRPLLTGGWPARELSRETPAAPRTGRL